MKYWSGRRGSNPRPRPWQGRALPLSYTRVREGWRRCIAVANGRPMPNAPCECNSRTMVRYPKKITQNQGQSRRIGPEPWIDGRQAVLEADSRPAPASAARSDSSHLANAPRTVPVSWSRRSGAHSKFAHHSTKARLPSMTSKMRRVARKPLTGREGHRKTRNSGSDQCRTARARAGGYGGPKPARS